MFFYTGINLIILVIAGVSYTIYKKRSEIFRTEEVDINRDYTNTRFFIICVFLILVIITGFRGQFSVDYAVYYDIFNQAKEASLLEVIQGKINVEVGYAIFNKIVSYIFRDCIYLMIIIASITIFCYLRIFKKYSKSVYVSVILLLCIGSYYTCFNTTRIALAAALVFLSSIFLYKEESIWYYFICIILISTIHKSVLVMIPLYFILESNMLKSKKRKYLILLILLFIILFFFFGKMIISQLAMIFYPNYINNGYGMNWGNSIVTLCRPVAVIVFLWIHRKYINLEDKKERIWVNGSILFFIISILACNIRIIYRFYYYVQPFVLLLIPNILYKMPEDKRRIWTFIVIVSGIAYLLISNVLNHEMYYFIWQYKIYNY